jgi:hypothetical protein
MRVLAENIKDVMEERVNKWGRGGGGTCQESLQANHDSHSSFCVKSSALKTVCGKSAMQRKTLGACPRMRNNLIPDMRNDLIHAHAH